MKQWISLLLAMVLLLACIPVGAMATEEDGGTIISEPVETTETEPEATEDPPLEEPTEEETLPESLEQPAVKLGNIYEGISVKWNATPDAEVYEVYRMGADGIWELLKEQTAISYQDKTAADGETYSYCVVAKNDEARSGNALTAQILRLAKPQASVTNAKGGISVTWNQVEGADTYRVYRKVPGTSSWDTLKTGLTSLSYTDTTAKTGTAYLYTVRAYNTTGGSSYKATAQIVRMEPTSAKASNAYNGIQITWNKIAAAASYEVYRLAADGTWELLKDLTATTYLDKTAEEGVTHSYRVVAKNGDPIDGADQSVEILRLAKPDFKVINHEDGLFVHWEPVEGAETYRVYRRAPGASSWETLKTGLTGTAYTDTKAKNGDAYQYTVRAYNTTGGSAYEASAAIIRLAQPTVTAENKADGIQLTWDTVKGAESYEVYRDGELLTTETGTSYRDTGLQSGVTYAYCIRAVAGESISNNDTSVSILRLDRPVVTTSVANNGIAVKWEAIEGAQSYGVYRKVVGGSWKTLATGVTELKYADTSAKSGTTYQYTVRACGDGVRSSYTATKQVQFLTRPTVTASTASTTSVKLQWKAIEGAKEYIVYIKNVDGEWETMDTVTGTSYTAQGLTFGETYSFSVRTVGNVGQSTRSAAVSGKATYPAPSYSVELQPGKGIKVSWTAIDGAGSYRVYRREVGGSWKTLKTTTSTSYVDTTGTPGVTYEYGVRAFELENAEGIYGVRADGKTAVFSMTDPSKPMVALTFDDGPSVYTNDILDQLEKYNAHATFFVVGNRVSSYASTIKRAHDLGCEIGNHSWSHPQLSAISVKEMQNEISKTDEAIKKITGETPALLRPPYGAVDADVKAYAGKPLIHWSIDTLDWEHRTSSKTISSVLNNVRDGSIVLMHDIYGPTRDAAVSLIPTLISRGYQLVTVSEMAAYRGVTLQNGTIYYSIK